MPDSEKRIPTNLRMLLILEAVGRSDRALTPTEINDEIGLPKQTIHRLIATLTEEGFLVRDADRNRYRPARRLRLMASGLLHASRVSIVRHQILEEVAAVVKEAVNFVVPEEKGMKYLDRVETDWPFMIQLPRGTNVPFHATASGKTFMASLGRTHRRAFVHGLNLERLSPHTITDPGKMMEELDRIERQGYSVDAEEFIEGMTAVAVPVRDSEGRYLAALATHGPKERLDLANAGEIARTLQGFARRLSEALEAG